MSPALPRPHQQRRHRGGAHQGAAGQEGAPGAQEAGAGQGEGGLRGPQVSEGGHAELRAPGEEGVQVQVQEGLHGPLLREGAHLQEEENKEVCRGERVQVSTIVKLMSRSNSVLRPEVYA